MATAGAVAGLVTITPACGWAGPMGAIVLGLLVFAGRHPRRKNRRKPRRFQIPRTSIAVMLTAK